MEIQETYSMARDIPKKCIDGGGGGGGIYFFYYYDVSRFIPPGVPLYNEHIHII